MQKGFLLYMVGISGSGKTTIARELEKNILSMGKRPLQVIDGDVIRGQFGDIFGYTYEERMKCNQAVRVVVQYLVDNGINVILTQVAAYQKMRDTVRDQFKDNYLEVFVKCSLEECIRRDVKGYYAKGIDNLNGSTDVFETPRNSELVVDTEKEDVGQAAQKIILYMKEHGYEL